MPLGWRMPNAANATSVNKIAIPGPTPLERSPAIESPTDKVGPRSHSARAATMLAQVHVMTMAQAAKVKRGV